MFTKKVSSSGSLFLFSGDEMKPDITEKATEIAAALLASRGMELVDLEYKREGRQMVLRLFIDREGGVTLDDCAEVSREVSEVLDVEDFIHDNYTLEVSSPGVNRPLKKESDFLRFRGSLVKVRTFELLPDEEGNRRKTFLGDLVDFRDDNIHLKLREGQDAVIPLAKVAKANLEFEF